ncbi:MAG TPA: DUF3667 domain-containing protein [Steroidobacteraceae bacterium]|jgi:hypothetical protein|nr:DUF3667 domain-containing protein [Steroidobacteraceae bacterium]
MNSLQGHCKNCGAALLGRFCVNCSQAGDVHVPTTRELVHEFLEGLTHSDSRLWRTLTTLWFKPGKLTTEFVAGRRVAYLPPFRLYLIVSIVFFFIASSMHTRGELMSFDDALKPASAPGAPASGEKRITSCNELAAADFLNGHPNWKPRVKHTCDAMTRDSGDNLFHIAIGTMPKAMFIFLPLIAFLHMLMYWHPRHRYAEQLLFFVHLHAFFFSVAILMSAAVYAGGTWPKISGTTDVLDSLLGWSLPVYSVLAMRRVFRGGWAATLVKGVALFFVYMIVFGLTVAGVFVYAIWQL